jgi:Heterokaryon incompatibility protein (HET)
MWLIDTFSLELKEFVSEQGHKYAIVSHRWEENPTEEVTFQDFRSMDLDRYSNKKGLLKIRGAQEQARKEEIPYFWIDTCCIDKSSSAELSEAINSMYRWYSQAAVGYAYLSDVPNKPFEESEWFTRGWTLQELLAPNKVTFFDGAWVRLGDKQTLSERIAAASKIDTGVLHGRRDIYNCSVAERMSWASARTTTRIEDSAYSLLGIFDINMPMLYGEGEKAFRRLQEEIIKRSDDHSIFAWTGVEDGHPGLLARSPAGFRDGAKIMVEPDAPSISIGKKGIETSFSMCACTLFTSLVRLSCVKHPGEESIMIYLRRFPGSQESARVRVGGEDLVLVRAWYLPPTQRLKPMTVLQATDLTLKEANYFSQPSIGFRIWDNLTDLTDHPYRLDGAITDVSASWDDSDENKKRSEMPDSRPRSIKPDGMMLESLHIINQNLDRVAQVIRLGLDSNMEPVCAFTTSQTLIGLWVSQHTYKNIPTIC